MRVQKANDPLARFRLGEIGYLGLSTANGTVTEETRRELRWPEAARTFRQMAGDPTIKAALVLNEMMVQRVDWYVDKGINPSAEMKRKAQFIEECMNDMDHSWYSMIGEMTSCFTYGFAVMEKVYRPRLYAKGSKFNDGKIGLMKIVTRAQDTIVEWIWSDDGRRLLGCKQDLARVTNGQRFVNLMTEDSTKVSIPRAKFLLLRLGVSKDNPEGESPLKACYISWRYRTQIEEYEAVGISRDMNGMPTLYIPPRYLSQDATPAEKEVREYYERVMRNIHMNEQAGLILPQAFDPESKQPLFKFELMGTNGSKMYDTDAIIRRYDNKILMALFADMLKLGQDQSGSYALAGEKTNIMSMAIEAKLKMIQEELNNDLVKQLLQLNGEDITKDVPVIRYKNIAETDLAEFAKAVQQIFAVNAIEFDRPVANRIREVLKVAPKPEDEPINKDELLQNETGAGEGMAAGMGNGTSTSAAKADRGTANASKP